MLIVSHITVYAKSCDIPWELWRRKEWSVTHEACRPESVLAGLLHIFILSISLLRRFWLFASGYPTSCPKQSP